MGDSLSPASVEIQKHRIHCRLCEAQCGIIASVQNNEVVRVEPNADHVLSGGHFCIKSTAAAEINRDPDRVTKPLRRIGGPGEFVEVDWEEAFEDIGKQLSESRSIHGQHSFASFIGNPSAFHWRLQHWYGAFVREMGIRWQYGINSEDAASRMMASSILFGIGDALRPDLWRTDFAIIIGSNPFVSHASTIVEPKVRAALKGIVDRGGRVVVVDPRRTETAKAFEHIYVRPGSDPFFLIGLIRALFDEQLVDAAAIEPSVDNLTLFRELIEPFDLDLCSAECGVSTEQIRQIAVDFASAESALVHGRVGTCTQRFGTLNNMLQDIIVLLTGNIERVGGLLRGASPTAADAPDADFEAVRFGMNRSRVRGAPDVIGLLPSTSFVPDVMTPGEGQVRSLVAIATNPVLTSAGGGEAMMEALESLDLFIAADLYINETNRHADYILPVKSFYERDDFVAIGDSMLRPAIWYSHAVVTPPDGVRGDEEILHGIAASVGVAIAADPEQAMDDMLASEPIASWIKGRGISVATLKTDFPDGAVIRRDLPVRRIEDWVRTPDHKISIANDIIASEFERLKRDQEHGSDPDFPLRVIGQREIKSLNSWLHNIERVMPDNRTQQALISVEDAARLDIRDGEDVAVVSKSGVIVVAAKITSDLKEGTVALPHGWGHNGGWMRANRAGGSNSNIIASSDVADIEAVAGASILNGIPVRLERVQQNPAAVMEA